MAVTTDNPPTYEEVKREIELLKDRLRSDPQLQKKLDVAFVKEVTKPGSGERIREEVNVLTSHVIDVDKAFERVRQSLYRVDLEDYKHPDSTPVEKFHPKWKRFQERWDDLLKKSRHSAVVTQAYIEDFSDTIIPIVQGIKTAKDKDEALLELNSYLSKPDPRGRTLVAGEDPDHLARHSEDFIQLKSDLQAFKSTFDTFANEQKVIIEGRVKQLQSEVADAQKELERAQELLIVSSVFLGLTVASMIAGAIVKAVFHSLTPLLVIIFILEIISLSGEIPLFIHHLHDFQEKAEKLGRLENDLAKEQERLERLKNLKAILDSQNTGITGICDRIDSLDSIWLSVAHDADLIRQKLEITGMDGPGFEAVQERVTQMKGFYISIGQGLNTYGSGTDPKHFTHRHE